MPQTPLNQRGPADSRHTVPRTASNTSQYSESARGSQPPEGGIFLPCCFAFLVGCRRVTRKAKSTPMSRHSLSKAQPLRETDCLTLDVMHLLEHNRALITIYFPFPVR
jgi:hypothetical protein